VSHAEPQLQITRDGSHTLYSSVYNQQYHDTNGAIDESNHVFIEQSTLLRRLKNNEDVHIFEMGFGTGLNLLLVAEAHAQYRSTSKITYTSIEGYPISPATASKLNYSDLLQHTPPNISLEFIFRDSKPGLNRFVISPHIDLNLFIGMYDAYEYVDLPIDIIFFDAFSPKANPELWKSSVFDDLIKHTSDKCVLSTYCAAVSARAAMCYAGWHVARGPGFKTRREITIASNDPMMLNDLKRVDEQRYTTRYANGEFANTVT
jgi:tRNA U34 5-methylaminomethyl-2-thiouridine-forming methyltransferase MnmC